MSRELSLHLSLITLLFALHFILPEYHHGNLARVMVLARAQQADERRRRLMVARLKVACVDFHVSGKRAVVSVDVGNAGQVSPRC